MKKVLLIIMSMILCMSFTSCQNYDEPISATEIYHDCEYTITLDKSKYDIGDTVVATVSFVNKGNRELNISSSDSLHFLSSIIFQENGEMKLESKTISASTFIRGWSLSPGEGAVFVKEFDLDNPIETDEEPIKMDSEWKIVAATDKVFEDETISVEIIVPH